MNIPKWICKQFDDEARAKVTKAIEQAELKTSGEIVPVIVSSSAGYAYVFWILFFAFLALLEAAWGEAIYLEFLPGAWWEGVLLLVASGVAALVLSRIPWVIRVIADNGEMDRAALMRAQNEFYQNGLHETHGATGVLIFVSLLEHEAVVLADRSISEKLPKETWDGVLATLIDGIRKEDLAEGLCAAVAKCGDILAKEYPRAHTDRDELPNRLIVKE